MIRRLVVAPELFTSFQQGARFEVVAEGLPKDVRIVERGVDQHGDFYIDMESGSFDTSGLVKPPIFKTLP